MPLARLRNGVLLVLLTSGLSILSAQDRGHFTLVFNPIGFKMNSIVWEEFGLGYYDIKNNLTNNMSVLGMYKRQISNRFSLNVGLGVRQNKYNFDYIITHPFDNQVIIEEVNRYYNRYNLVTHFGLSWALDKFEISIGYEFPFELFSKTNIEIYYGPIEIFLNPETQNIASYRIVEKNSFTDDVFRLATPVLMCDYRLCDKISLNLTSLVKPYGNIFLYQLDVQGETGYMPEGDYRLNDSRINNQNVSFYFGIKYTFN